MSKEVKNLGHEENDIKLRGIIGFAIGLVVLIVATFVLMYIMKGVMEEQFASGDKVDPMVMTKPSEKLPPEPRLQGAPGFGVDGKDGRINLELQIPQAEYRTLTKIWNELEEKGQKDEKTGAVISLPMKEAKALFLQEVGKTVKVREAVKPEIELPKPEVAPEVKGEEAAPAKSEH
jgi:hypothetical protein